MVGKSYAMMARFGAMVLCSRTFIFFGNEFVNQAVFMVRTFPGNKKKRLRGVSLAKCSHHRVQRKQRRFDALGYGPAEPVTKAPGSCDDTK